MRMIFGAVAVLSLTGCVTTSQDMRTSTPTFEATSQRSAQEIAGCIGTRLVGATALPMTSVPTENGYTFSAQGEVMRDVTIDVIDEGSQRRLKAYYRRFLGITAINESAHIEIMKGCLAG